MQCEDIQTPRKESKPPVHPDKGELLVRVKAPGEAMEDASLVEALGPAAVLPLHPSQTFKTILLVLALKIGHLVNDIQEWSDR